MPNLRSITDQLRALYATQKVRAVRVILLVAIGTSSAVAGALTSSAFRNHCIWNALSALVFWGLAAAIIWFRMRWHDLHEAASDRQQHADQRVSFAYGNTKLAYDNLTPEMTLEEADAVIREAGGDPVEVGKRGAAFARELAAQRKAKR